MTVHLGFMAAAAVLTFIALENGKSWMLVPVAMICAALSAHSLLQGAWPIAAIEAIWMVIILRRNQASSRRNRMR